MFDYFGNLPELAKIPGTFNIPDNSDRSANLAKNVGTVGIRIVSLHNPDRMLKLTASTIRCGLMSLP